MKTDKQSESNQAKIISEAETLFEKKGYNQASISQIMKATGLSVPLFYYYFRDKEDIFLHIADSMSLDMYRAIVKYVKDAKSSKETLFNFYYSIFRFISANSKRFKVFREVEFVDKNVQGIFYTRLFSLLKRELGNDFDEVLLDVTFGAGYFIALKFVIWDKRKDFKYLANAVTDFVLNGIGTGSDFVPELPEKIDYFKEKKETLLAKGEKTQAKIAETAKRLFGKKGYWETQISDIAREAGIGIGTFYLYFNSKKELLRHIVVSINKGLRENAMMYSLSAKDRKEVEVNSLKAFADFIMKEKEAYRIVREAEFVDEEIGKWYYERLGGPYAKALSLAMEKGEIRKIDPEVLAYSLMGIGHFLGVQWIFWKNSNNIPDKVLLEAASIIINGIKNYNKGGI